MTAMVPPAHVVVVRLTALGDALLVTPVLEALRARWPEATLTFVTGEAQAPLFEGLPGLDRVIGWSRGRHGGASGLARLAEEIRAAGPVALYVDLQHKARTVLLGRLLRPRARRVWRRRRGGAVLLAALGRDPVQTAPHATRRYFEALEGLGVRPDPPGGGPLLPRVVVPGAAEAAAADRLPGDPPRLAVAPAARWATKRWAPERFAEVAQALAEGEGAEVVLVAGPGDDEAADAFLRALGRPAAVDTRSLDLADTAAVLARCDVLVAGDTGPGHLAAALGVPVVSVFGPTSPERWAPAHPRAVVVRQALDCMPCSNHGTARCPLGHHRCLGDLGAAPVIVEARRLLAGRPRAHGAGGRRA